jgi:hypothetical protein
VYENVAVSCPRTKKEENPENPADRDFRRHPGIAGKII